MLNFIYTATSPSGEFPGISEFEHYSILKQMYPINKLQVKDDYSLFELKMITSYVAYFKGISDLKNNNIDRSLMCGLRIEPDLKCIYMLGLFPMSNEDAKAFVEKLKAATKKTHKERIEIGIRISNNRKD